MWLHFAGAVKGTRVGPTTQPLLHSSTTVDILGKSPAHPNQLDHA